MRLCATLRHLLGFLVVALLSAGTAAVTAPSSSAAVSTPLVTGNEDDTRTNALYYVAGYLWSDGWGSSPNFGYRTSTPAIAARFELAARSLGIDVIREVDGRFVTFRLRGLVVDLPLDRVPPLLQGASEGQTKAFLAAVIEGEGQRSGLVIDDPELDHVLTVRRLLRRVEVRTYREGVNFVRLYAVRADWPEFDSFPFVTRSRVPGATT